MLRSTASAVAVLSLSTASFADDLSPPPWRLNPGTTVQHWDFSGGPAGGAPDALPYNNPYGVGAILTPLAPATLLPNFMGRNDVWDLNGTTGGGGLDFFVSNTGITTHQKNIWLQITYWSPVPPLPLGVNITSGSGPFNLVSTTTTPLPGGWFHELTVWNVGSCPQKEVVHLFPLGTAAFIDQVVIDTQCIPVPTPGAAATLALGGILAVRRRR